MKGKKLDFPVSKKTNLKHKKILYYRSILSLCKYLNASCAMVVPVALVTLVFNLILIISIKQFVEINELQLKILFFILIGSGLIFFLIGFCILRKLPKKIEHYKKKLNII
jgi:hypothetical protein